MKKISITEASELVKVSRDKIRYGAKLLGIKFIKQGRVSYVPSNSITILKAMYKNVSTGMSPSIAAKEVLEIFANTPEPALEVAKEVSNNNVLTNRIETLEQAVMLLVEENQMQRKLLNKRFDRLELQLNPPEHKKIEVWKPTKPKSPTYSTLQRIWYEVTNPEKLRAN